MFPPLLPPDPDRATLTDHVEASPDWHRVDHPQASARDLLLYRHTSGHTLQLPEPNSPAQDDDTQLRQRAAHTVNALALDLDPHTPPEALSRLVDIVEAHPHSPAAHIARGSSAPDRAATADNDTVEAVRRAQAGLGSPASAQSTNASASTQGHDEPAMRHQPRNTNTDLER